MAKPYPFPCRKRVNSSQAVFRSFWNEIHGPAIRHFHPDKPIPALIEVLLYLVSLACLSSTSVWNGEKGLQRRTAPILLVGWGVLDTHYLSCLSDLKHIIAVAGPWGVVGILDSFTDFCNSVK